MELRAQADPLTGCWPSIPSGRSACERPHQQAAYPWATGCDAGPGHHHRRSCWPLLSRRMWLPSRRPVPQNSDCGSGCTCSGGQCRCCDRPRPPKPGAALSQRDRVLTATMPATRSGADEATRRCSRFLTGHARQMREVHGLCRYMFFPYADDDAMSPQLWWRMRWHSATWLCATRSRCRQGPVSSLTKVGPLAVAPTTEAL